MEWKKAVRGEGFREHTMNTGDRKWALTLSMAMQKLTGCSGRGSFKAVTFMDVRAVMDPRTSAPCEASLSKL